jgi:hypothetical protein
MRLLDLSAVLLLSAVWATAQTSPSGQTPTVDPNNGQTNTGATTAGSSASGTATGSAASDSSMNSDSGMSKTNAGADSVQGCLGGADGNYTLTDKSGTSYRLTGDTAKLSEHIGHEVKVSGTKSAATATDASDTMGKTGGAQQSIQVSSVKHISKTCQNAGSTMK